MPEEGGAAMSSSTKNGFPSDRACTSATSAVVRWSAEDGRQECRRGVDIETSQLEVDDVQVTTEFDQRPPQPVSTAQFIAPIGADE